MRLRGRGIMHIHSWGQTAGVCGTQGVSGTSSTGACVPADASSDCTTQVAFSEQTGLIQKLSALKSSDAAAFKSVAGRVAEHFLQRAAYLQGSDGEELQRLGVAFASAAESGDLSAFQSLANTPAAPPPPPVDALASALSLVDSITGTSSASGAESFATLSALKQSSPTDFKQVMNRVSEGLSQLAHYAQGADKESLSQLAVDFASAAESGDISAFAPPAAPAPSVPPAAPFDALGAAFGLVDSLTGSESASSAESFATLSALKQSSPAEFKQLMNRVSEGLSQLAHYAQGAEKDSLSQLAVDFASAAESGDISAFGAAVVASVPPPAPQPVDALGAAFELIDSISGTSSADRSESFAKLSALKQSSPSEFKELMNRVSAGLSQLAHYAEGSDRDTLSAFAVSIASAAESGDISAFAPASGPVASTPPPAPPPFDALGAAFELVDSVTGSPSASSCESFEKLSDLKQSSPAQFKQVMNRVAEGLAQSAHYAEGADRDALSQMSTRFASAAESGDLSSFAPVSEPAEAEPEPCEEPSAPVCEQWRCGQALSAYRNCASEPVSAVDCTYASALALVNSLTSAQAA